MREAEPEKYAVTLTIRLSEEERYRLKLLAVKEKKTLKAVLFAALDKAFPQWRNIRPKLD